MGNRRPGLRIPVQAFRLLSAFVPALYPEFDSGQIGGRFYHRGMFRREMHDGQGCQGSASRSVEKGRAAAGVAAEKGKAAADVAVEKSQAAADLAADKAKDLRNR